VAQSHINNAGGYCLQLTGLEADKWRS